ncbi:ATP-binding protein [Luteolibacter sp. Populi]|uniref:GAF domain-containing sensor histidine kinase n=1 Tax=Luteolibacter sp. Populi TaxID=3230487 RepID=UPI0034652E6C
MDRIAALRRYEILDTPPDGSFDGITALAAKLLGVPIALATLVDTDRIWFKSKIGLDVEQIDRAPGLCASAILNDAAYIVNNAALDPRTLANPLVAGEFGLRFYAAAPLQTHDGFNLGTLCVIDREPRQIDEQEVEILRTLAGLIMDQMELRIASRRIDEKRAAIAAKNRELAILNEEKDGFMAMAAHDLRNPLGTVMMMGKMLEEQKVGALNERQLRMVSAICESSEVMLRLVTDYLEFTALGPIAIKLTKDDCDLQELVEACVRDHAPRAGEKSIGILFHRLQDGIVAAVDASRIRQGVGNLIGNAVKFSPAGSRIAVRCLKEGEFAVIEVIDQGPGIPESELSKLFIPFSPTSVLASDGEKSTGLGLSIAKRLVEAHRGEIAVSSVVGEGSTFSIKLPL